MRTKVFWAVVVVLIVSIIINSVIWWCTRLNSFVGGAVVSVGAVLVGVVLQSQQQARKAERGDQHSLNLLAVEFIHNVELARQTYVGFLPESYTLPDYGFMFTYWETIGPMAVRPLGLPKARRIRHVIYQLKHLERKVDFIINPSYSTEFRNGVRQRYCLMLECADDASFDEIIGYLSPLVDKEIQDQIINISPSPVQRKTSGIDPCP